MSRWIKNDRTNTIQLLVLIVGVVILSYWAVVSLTARDPLWFAGEFEGQPSRVVVYHMGQRTELLPGQAGFDELASAVQATLDQGFARLTSLGLSEQSLQDAYAQYVTLEVFFDQPVTLRSWFNAGRTTQMLFLITGRHAEMSVVLLGDQGEYRAGAPALKTMEPIQGSLKSLGFY
jgi:hypothetical protein